MKVRVCLKDVRPRLIQCRFHDDSQLFTCDRENIILLNSKNAQSLILTPEKTAKSKTTKS